MDAEAGKVTHDAPFTQIAGSFLYCKIYLCRPFFFTVGPYDLHWRAQWEHLSPFLCLTSSLTNSLSPPRFLPSTVGTFNLNIWNLQQRMLRSLWQSRCLTKYGVIFKGGNSGGPIFSSAWIVLFFFLVFTSFSLYKIGVFGFFCW